MTRRTSRGKYTSGSMGNSGLTPLLDVLFLLLFAVLASTDSASTDTPDPEEVRVELPAVDPLESGAGDEDEAVRIFLRIDADGTVTIIDEDGPHATPTAGELRAALTEAMATAGATGHTIVEIRADADARHGVTVDVLQTVRAVGIVDVRFVATAGPDDNDDARPLGGSHPVGGSREVPQ